MTLPTLIKQEEGNYGWVDEGILILHPVMTSRGQCDPKTYGFKIEQTGGGCTAWTQRFLLEDGREVEMMLTQDLSHNIDVAEPVEIGLYLDAENNEECFAFWTIDLDYNVKVDTPYQPWSIPE